MQVGLLTRAVSVAGVGGGLLVVLLDCSSFDSTSDPPTAPDASDATALVDASGTSPDAGGRGQDASEDGGCEGAFIDDFDRPTPGGGPWDQYQVELGDAGSAWVDAVDGGRALGVAFLANEQEVRFAVLSKTFPEKTRFVDVAFKQRFFVGDGGTPTWLASLVTLESVEPGATVSQGFVLVNSSAANLIASREPDEGGTPAYASTPVALLGEHDVRLTATFGAGGGIVSVVDGVTTTIPFATVPASRRLQLGLAIGGSGAPDLAVEYRNVSVCWR